MSDPARVGPQEMDRDRTSSRSSASASSQSPMPKVVNRSSLFPLHGQVRELLLNEIQSGHLQPGDKVPPEEEYAAQLGISVAPVRQAILGLVNEGWLTRTRGRGTFVRPAPVTETVTTLSGFRTSMREKGRSIEMRILNQQVVSPPSWVTESLKPTKGKVFELRRLAVESSGPIAILTSYLDHYRFPKITTEDFSGLSLYEFLRDECGMRMVRAENMVQVIRCTAEESQLLATPLRAPVLRASHVTFAQDDKAIEAAVVLYPADRVRLAFESRASYLEDEAPNKGGPL